MFAAIAPAESPRLAAMEQSTAHKRLFIEGPGVGPFGYGNAPQSRFFPRTNQPM